MRIEINREISEPPTRDYSKRNSEEVRAERLVALTALQSLEVGQSIQFTGEDVPRDRINSYLASLKGSNYPAQFATAKIYGGLGVWRIP